MPDVRLAHMGPFLCLQELRGNPEPPRDLINRVAFFGWNQLVLKTARIAAVMAHEPGGALAKAVVETTRVPLERLVTSPSAEKRVVATYVASHPGPIAHEAVIYFVLALALLYGADDGPMPNDEAFAYLLLAANDHCMAWVNDSERNLTRNERNLAVVARAALHNDRQDPASKFVRGCMLLEGPPSRTPGWTAPDDWKTFQLGALGVPLPEYLETLAGPLVLVSRLWGDLDDTEHPYPIIEPSMWLPAFPKSREFVDRLSMDRDQAKRELKVRDDGLPVGPTVFHRYPFIRLAEDVLVAASPWAVQQVMNTGLWAKHLSASKKEFGNDAGAKRWSGAFGDMFEAWCVRVAAWAQASPGFRGHLVDAPELGDVVFVHGRNVVIIEAKSRLVREDHLKGATSVEGALEFFDDFFFANRDGAYRGGAVRQLDANIQALRTGKFEPEIDRNALVLPCVATFDDMGTDNPSMYRWLKRRCGEENLLQGRRLRHLTVMDIDLFELLLGVSICQRGIVEILKRKTEKPWDEARLSVLLSELAWQREVFRVPQITEAFDQITKRIQALLFPSSRLE
jgi:hypothetical protein